MLTVDHWPTLDRPLLVVALSGWVDAGVAGEGAVHALVEQLLDADPFATLDLTDLLDLQQTRPTAQFVEGGMRVIDWPEIQFVSGRVGRDVVVVHGPEPSLRWPAVAEQIVEAARRLGVVDAVTLGGHARAGVAPPRASRPRDGDEPLARAGGRPVATRLRRPDRHADDRAARAGRGRDPVRRLVGPGAAIRGRFTVAARGARVARARMAEVHRVDLHFQGLDARSEAYLARVEEGLAARPDVKEIVDRLDREAPRRRGDELVDEIERFLRSQSEE